MVVPVGAGLLLYVHHLPVWEGEETWGQDEPSREGEGKTSKGGVGGWVPGHGDGNQNHLVGGKKIKGERRAFQETEARFPPSRAAECQPWEISQCLVSS